MKKDYLREIKVIEVYLNNNLLGKFENTSLVRNYINEKDLPKLSYKFTINIIFAPF